MRWRVLSRAVFWLALLTVAVLALSPGEYLPPQAINWWDKAQHALAFVVLALLGLPAYPRDFGRLAAGLLAFGGLIELAQSTTGWRFGDWADWLADCLGVAVVMAPAWWWGRFHRSC